MLDIAPRLLNFFIKSLTVIGAAAAIFTIHLVEPFAQNLVLWLEYQSQQLREMRGLETLPLLEMPR